MNIRAFHYYLLILSFVILIPGIFYSRNLTSLTLLYLFIAQGLLLFPSLRFCKSNPVNPFTMLYLVFFLANILRAAYINFASDLDIFKYYITNVSEYEFEMGSLIVLMGTLGLVCAGMLVRVKSINKPYRILRAHSNYNRSFVFLICVGLVMLVLVLITSDNPFDFSTKRQFTLDNGEVTRFGPLRFLLNIVIFGLQYIFFVRLFSGEKLSSKMSFIILLFIGLAAFIISKRSFILLTFLPILLIYTHKFNFKRYLVSGFAVFVFLSVLALISSERKVDSNGFLATYEAVWESTIESSLLSANYGGFIATTISTIVIDGLFNEPVGKTLAIDPVLQFVPRSMYPAKSEELGGRIRELHQTLGVAPIWLKGGVPPGLIAEFWLNGGFAAVIAMSALVGWLFVIVSKKMLATRTAEAYAAYFFIAQVVVFFGFGGHTARVLNYSLSLVVVILLIKLIESIGRAR